MKEKVSQGDIIKLDNLSNPVLILSKDFFNNSGIVIGCPITKNSIQGPLHIKITGIITEGFAECERLKQLDLNIREYTIKDRIPKPEIIDITDAVQSVFDYV